MLHVGHGDGGRSGGGHLSGLHRHVEEGPAALGMEDVAREALVFLGQGRGTALDVRLGAHDLLVARAASEQREAALERRPASRRLLQVAVRPVGLGLGDRALPDERVAPIGLALREGLVRHGAGQVRRGRSHVFAPRPRDEQREVGAGGFELGLARVARGELEAVVEAREHVACLHDLTAMNRYLLHARRELEADDPLVVLDQPLEARRNRGMRAAPRHERDGEKDERDERQAGREGPVRRAAGIFYHSYDNRSRKRGVQRRPARGVEIRSGRGPRMSRRERPPEPVPPAPKRVSRETRTPRPSPTLPWRPQTESPP